MLNEGFRNIYLAPSLLLWPALAIGLSVGALVLLGNAVRDALERTSEKPVARRPVPAAKTVATARPVAAPSSALLDVRNLAVSYPRPDGTEKSVVHDVSLTVARGEVLGLVGESGSGKSQTAFSVLGLPPAQAILSHGTIDIDGVRALSDGAGRVDGAALARMRGRRIGYVPQEPMSNLDPAYTVGSQLVRPMGKTGGRSKPEAQAAALDLLASVGIADPRRTFDAHPHEISGGMAQRVLIAGALSCDPELVIADEPTTALDVTVQAEVLDILRDLRDNRGVGMLLVTRNFGVVTDRVAVMESGRIVERGPTRDVLRDPQHPYTRTLLGSMLAGKTPMTTLTAVGQGDVP